MAHDNGHRDVGKPAGELLQWMPPELVQQVLRRWRTMNQLLASQLGSVFYEVIDYQVDVSIEDVLGRHARIRRREEIRALMDNIRAYQHLFWGDGDVVRRYWTNQGPAVDRLQNQGGEHLLVWLEGPMRKGDTRVIETEQAALGMFTKPQEWYEVLIRHLTHQASCAITFPRRRSPGSVEVREISPDATSRRPLPYRIVSTEEGRWQLSWRRWFRRLVLA